MHSCTNARQSDFLRAQFVDRSHELKFSKQDFIRQDTEVSHQDVVSDIGTLSTLVDATDTPCEAMWVTSRIN